MCGIAGIYCFADAPAKSNENLLSSVKVMTEVMHHRGPDGNGTWRSDDGRIGFGHTRLAIVDLSDDASQPMSNGDGSTWITFNGEIYNHLALRQQLLDLGRTFKTDHSDTEVLIHGYDQWGIKGLLERLDGMFAFAIWDTRKERLVLARDRIGIKPLYFTRTDNSFHFASEIKAILSDRSIPRDIDTSAFNHYLSFMIAPAPLTMFKDIFKLPSGHFMEVDINGKVSAQRYWDALPGQGIAAQDIENLSEAEQEHFYTTGIRARLEAAIKKRMMSDVPIGVFLSGGIDSSANVALMSQMRESPVDTFTVGFKDHPHLNELEYANRVARDFNTNHHEILIDENDMIGFLDDLVHHQDEPIADWVCIPLYFVSKLAKDSGVTVVQVGEGSDEQFCGYDSYMTYLKLYRTFWSAYNKVTPKALQSLLAKMAAAFSMATGKFERYAEVLERAARGHELFWSGANAFWNVHKRRLGIKGGTSNLPDWLKQSGIDLSGLASEDSGNIIDAYMHKLRQKFPNAGHLTRMIYNEFRLRLPELLLMRVDKIAMSTAIEGRVPFLDHKLVEFTMDIPTKWKIKNNDTKYLLKKALGDILPDEILYRPKMGFAAPMADWFRGKFGDKAENTILGSKLLERCSINPDHIADLFKDHRSGGGDHALHLWVLFNAAAWYDHWIDVDYAR